MTPPFALRQVLRDGRGAGGRLTFFVLCLATGVAAVVAVAGFSAGLDSGIRSQARQLLAGDLSVDGFRPHPPNVSRELDALASEPGVSRALLVETITMVSTGGTWEKPGKSQLVELKAVEGGYPFYGELKTGPSSVRPGGRPRGEHEGPLSGLLDESSVLVAPDLLSRLGLAEGDTLQLGGQPFRIAGTLLGEPDRLGGAYAIGPRVLLTKKGLDRTPLEGFGSRVLRRTLLKLPKDAGEGAVEAAKARLVAAALADKASTEVRVQTYREAQPQLRQALARVDRFLSLVALLSLLVGGIGVAQTVRAFVAQRLDDLAVLRCLGLRSSEVAVLVLLQSSLLGLAGSLAGAGAGLALLSLLPRLVADVLPAGLVSVWQPLAVARGVLLGTSVAILFSLPPVLAAGRVPPLRVLRREADPLPPRRLVVALLAAALVGGVVATAAVQSRSLVLAAAFTGALVLAAGILFASARGLLVSLSAVPRASLTYRLRHPLASLTHPAAGTVGSVVALGLGVLVVLSLSLVERQLSRQLLTALPTAAPTAFFLDIQRDQWERFQELLSRAGAEKVDSVPVVMARLSKLDGRSVEDLAKDKKDNERWALTREQRLTWVAKLPEDNRIVAGKLFADPGKDEVSVEVEFARSLGVGVGSTIELDVQGVPVTLHVTSLREVDWRTFGINFFFVVEPGVLEEAPQTRLAAVRMPREAEGRVQDLLARELPNVTMLRLYEILEKISSVLTRLGAGVRFLGAFTVLAGVVILAGTVSATSARRGREVALLKTLGLTRTGVVSLFAVEYVLVGLVAGLIGAVSAIALAWLVATRGLELDFTPDLARVAAAFGTTVVLTLLAGLLASARALGRPPIESIRAE